MKPNRFERLPWEGLKAACATSEAVWEGTASRLMADISSLRNIPDMGMASGEELPLEVIDILSSVIDNSLGLIAEDDYYLRMCIRFATLRTVIGALIMHCRGRSVDDRSLLVQLGHAVIVCSIRHAPFSLPLWKAMRQGMHPEDRAVMDEMIAPAEYTLMRLSGNCVYSFFTDRCTRPEVDRLLGQARQAVEAAEAERRCGPRCGNGHSKLILLHVRSWQEGGKLRDMPRIMPFLRCLDAHWKHAYRLGCRQGIERMYVKMYNL